MKPALKNAQTRVLTRPSRDRDDDRDEDDDITNCMAHCSTLCNCTRFAEQQKTNQALFKILILFFVIKMLSQLNVPDSYKTRYTCPCLLILGSVLSSWVVLRCLVSVGVKSQLSVQEGGAFTVTCVKHTQHNTHSITAKYHLNSAGAQDWGVRTCVCIFHTS